MSRTRLSASIVAASISLACPAAAQQPRYDATQYQDYLQQCTTSLAQIRSSLRSNREVGRQYGWVEGLAEDGCERIRETLFTIQSENAQAVTGSGANILEAQGFSAPDVGTGTGGPSSSDGFTSPDAPVASGVQLEHELSAKSGAGQVGVSTSIPDGGVTFKVGTDRVTGKLKLQQGAQGGVAEIGFGPKATMGPVKAEVTAGAKIEQQLYQQGEKTPDGIERMAGSTKSFSITPQVGVGVGVSAPDSGFGVKWKKAKAGVKRMFTFERNPYLDPSQNTMKALRAIEEDGVVPPAKPLSDPKR